MILVKLFDRILNMSEAAGLIILIVLAVRFLLRRAPRIFSYILWAAVLFRLLCPVMPESSLSVFRLFETETRSGQTAAYFDGENAGVGIYTVSEMGILVQESVREPVVEQNTEIPVVQIVWLAGVAAMLLYGGFGALRLKKQLAGAVWQRDNVFLTDCAGTPFVIGTIHPRIYLPRGVSQEEKYYILAHEWQHIDRLDHVIKLVAYLALCVHWFNPLVWLAFFLAEKDMEMSCDEAVMETLGEGIRADYATALLCYAGGIRRARGTPLSFGENCTKSRVKNIAQWRRSGRMSAALGTALCILVMLTCMTDPAAAKETAYAKEIQEQAPVLSPEEQAQAIVNKEAHRSKAREYMGTWYLAGYYDVTLTVSEKYDIYTEQDAMHFAFSKYAPKLPVTIQYEDWRWNAGMSRYGIDLVEDCIVVKTSMGEICVFVRQQGGRSILDDYPHLNAHRSWNGATDPKEFAVINKVANDRCDKSYEVRFRLAESAGGQPTEYYFYDYASFGWFKNQLVGRQITVEDGMLKLYTGRGANLYREFTESNIWRK